MFFWEKSFPLSSPSTSEYSALQFMNNGLNPRSSRLQVILFLHWGKLSQLDQKHNSNHQNIETRQIHIDYFVVLFMNWKSAAQLDLDSQVN